MSIMGSAHGLETAIGTSVAFSGISTGKECGGLDFKIIWDCKTGPPIVIHLVAPTLQEKAAWTSDISQVITKDHFIFYIHPLHPSSSSFFFFSSYFLREDSSPFHIFCMAPNFQ